MFIDANTILSQTNGGLNVIISYYPQARAAAENANKKFKIREEKTPSCTLKRLKDGNWVVTDWGDDAVSRNAIQVVMKEENCDFKKALEIIASAFNIEGANPDLPEYKADFEKRPAKPDEQDGEYYFDMHEKCPEEWMKVLGPRVKPEHMQFLRFRSCKSFTYVKNREAQVTTSKDDYPIFIIEEEGFKKIYQPKNSDKKYRFRYAGTKPKNFIHGFDQLKKKHGEIVAKWLSENQDKEENSDSDEEPRLEEIIICSGDRDALNVHSLGYNVVWLNSESARLSPKDYQAMRKICKCVYNLPDIDATGIRQGSELALQYLDIKTIWLPKWISQLRDWRGNACKDITDFIKHDRFKDKDFKSLFFNALPARFWDEKWKTSRNGDDYTHSYEFNNVQAYYFLNLYGFYRFENKNEKTGYMYIKIDGNIVEEVEPVDVKNFVNNFLEERKFPVQLRNMIYKTTQLSELSLSNLKTIEVDFSDFDKFRQFIFFENQTWEISKDEIKSHRPGDANRFVWKDEVIPHRVKKLNEFFEITRHEMEDGEVEYDIKINNNDCLFFKYLINASRVHWRKELENHTDELSPEEAAKYRKQNTFKIDGEALTDDEIYEQKLHLINKIYSIGYLLHRYKQPSRPWCVFAMDNKITDEGESHGGSGKSICYNALRIFMKSVTLNGRNKRLTENPHVYENVSEHTDFLFIDDANQYIDFQFFFKALTGDLDVNPKNNRQYSIPFEDAPKFCITSNYTLRNIDPSTERRLLYTVFSDYYHYNSRDEYREHRDPRTEFGKELFTDFDEKEWNLFFNFIAQCVRVYLNYQKIDPPMENVSKRNLITEMNESFKIWADVYFTKENERTDKEILKSSAFDDFQQETKMTKWTMNRFTRSLKAWCRYYTFVLNPKAVSNNNRRILRKVEGDLKEYIYIQTDFETPAVDSDNNDDVDDDVDEANF